MLPERTHTRLYLLCCKEGQNRSLVSVNFKELTLGFCMIFLDSMITGQRDWFLKDGGVEGYVLIFCDSSLLSNYHLENAGSHQKKVSHIQGQRRSPNKTVGGVKLSLESNPILTRDAAAAAAAAKSLQSCPTLCDPIEGSPPGSSIPGILQARTLEMPGGLKQNLVCTRRPHRD